MPKVYNLDEATDVAYEFSEELTPHQAVVAAYNIYHHLKQTGEVLLLHEATEKFWHKVIRGKFTVSCGSYCCYLEGAKPCL